MVLTRTRVTEIEVVPGQPTRLDILWDENNRPLDHAEDLVLTVGQQTRVDSGLWTLKIGMVVTHRNLEEIRTRTAKLVGNAIVNMDPELNGQ